MHVTAEFLRESLILRVFGNQGNPARVIIGGSDGILVTIDANGKIVIIPPEGPGDPELTELFKSVFQGLNALGKVFQPCIVVEEEMGEVQQEIEHPYMRAPGVTVGELEQQYESLVATYKADGCEGKVGGTPLR